MSRSQRAAWVVFVWLAASLLPLRAQDEARAVAAFAKLFQQGAQAPVDDGVDARESAVEALHAFDSARTAAALAAAFVVLDAEAAAIEQQRRANNEELARLMRGQPATERGNLTGVQDEQRLDLLRKAKELVAQGAGTAFVTRLVGDRLAALRSAEALRHLQARVLGDRKAPLPLRLCAARALAAGGEAIVAELARGLARAKDSDELIATIDALALAGKVAIPHAEALLPLLQHADETVRERAALALAVLPVPGAIAPMVALLAKTKGQSLVRIVRALEVLTHQQFGVNIGAWQEWWERDGAAFLRGQPELGGGTPSQAADTGHDYYFGIPQEHSRAILYCVDCSGSMVDPVPVVGQTVGSKSATESRLDACKRELCRALARLRPDQQFAILWYDDVPHYWQPRMQAPTKAVVAEAVEFVRALRPASTTNIHDALEAGFALAGRGAHDRYYGLQLDTIFLLTDGTPTLVDGTPDATSRILRAVRAWNPLCRVTVHTIGIGEGLDDDFLEALAAQNGGEYQRL